MFQIKVAQKIKTHFVFSNFPPPPKIVPFMRKCGKTLYSRAGHRWQYDECALHAG